MEKRLVDTEYLRSLFVRGDVVAVAVSGGRDSMALLDYLKSSADETGITVKALNVEHGIRGDESVRDSEFVKKYCSEHGIELDCRSVDCIALKQQTGTTLEQAAREARYSFFEQALQSGFCTKVATAHHADDNAETVLLRILRGTGTKGLSGISPKRGGIVRPFLKTTRKQIDQYVENKNIPYVDDATNFAVEADRNFLRNSVIPLLKQRFPSVTESLLRLSENAAEENGFVDSCVPPIECGEGFAVVKLVGQENFVLKRQFEKAFLHLGVYADVEKRHFDLLVSLASSEAATMLNMPHGVVAVKESDGLRFYKNADFEKCEIPFAEGTYEFLGGTIEIRQKTVEDKLYFDFDAVPPTAVVRARRDGDYINKFGGGKKSLGDYLTDKKIPLYLRDRLAVVADGSRVLIVSGVDVSRDVRVTDKTHRVFTLTQK